MMITTMLIAVPTGIKIFSWLATLWRGVIHLRTPMLFALGFITMFTLGGISGIMLAVIPFTIHVSDTYFIVAHIHYVLFGGSVFTIFAGIYHWFPKMTGRMYDEIARQGPLLALVRVLQPDLRPDALRGHRRDAAAGGRLRGAVRDLERDHLDLGLHLRLSFLVFLHNMVASWRHGPPAPANPGAPTRSSGRSRPRRRCSTSAVPTVVGGPYEYGVPGAVHAVFKERKPATAPPAAGGAPPPAE